MRHLSWRGSLSVPLQWPGEQRKSWLRKSLLITAAALATICGAAQGSTSIAQKIAVPAYFVPGIPGTFWTPLTSSTPAVGIAVANVLNGPDFEAKSSYQSAIQAAHNAGIKVLGYVDTGYYGTTGLTTRLGLSGTEAWRSQIQHDIDAWYAFYGSSGLDGIFFDQGQNTCGTGNATSNLYKGLTDYVKENHAGAVTVLNPGIAIPQCYQNSADILLTFEGTYLCYIQDSSCPVGLRYQSPGWDPVDPKKFWHLVYKTTSEMQLTDAIEKSKQRKAGYVYITPDDLPNPWDSLPSGSFWSSEQTGMAPGGTVDTTAPTTPTSLDTVNEWYTWISLDWVKSTDSGSGVVAYDLFKDSVQIWSIPATSSTVQTHTVTGLQPTTWYTFTVKARDGAGNVSGSASPLSVETEPADGAPPTAPGTPAVSQVTYTSALLAWSASSDSDDAVAAYDVYRAGTKIMTVPASTTSARVLALQPGSTTAFTVKARDTEGNTSSASGTANVTTTALPGGQAIANPTGSYLSTTISYSADYLLPFAFRRVFIDSDNNASTGYHTFSSPSIGADYVIEGSTLLRHVGSTDAYTFDVVRSVTPSVSGNTVTWQILVSDLGSPGPTQKVTFQGDGFAAPTYSSVITLAQ
jgi:hypothetical protein